jgi:hypothetical protein
MPSRLLSGVFYYGVAVAARRLLAGHFGRIFRFATAPPRECRMMVRVSSYESDAEAPSRHSTPATLCTLRDLCL